MCGCGSVTCTRCAKRRKGVGSVVEWAEGKGFEFESEEGCKGWSLVVGWGGCECHGLVSNTLSLSMSAAAIHPSMVSHSAVCFKAIVFVATSINVLVLLCCPSSFTIKFCGLLPEDQLAACHPHGLKRERWGLSRYGLMTGSSCSML